MLCDMRFQCAAGLPAFNVRGCYFVQDLGVVPVYRYAQCASRFGIVFCCRRELGSETALFLAVFLARIGGHDFLVRFLRPRDRFMLASRLSISSFDTLNILRTALSMRSASVLPGT
jgi:hypothetical protein